MVKKSSRNRFNYNVDRRKLQKRMMKKEKPKIDCTQIRKAWDTNKSAKQNMRDMGLVFGSKGLLPIQDKVNNEPADKVLKPYVIKDMEAEASVPRKDKKECSTDLIEFVQHMIREHNEDYKAMARDDKNYYQDTPKQIKRKIEKYKRHHPGEYTAFVASLRAQKTS